MKCPQCSDVERARREALEEAATRAEQWAGDDLIPFITERDAQIRAHIVAAIRALAPQDGEQADAPTLEERVRHLELYGTAHVDSWVEAFAKRLDRIESAGSAPQGSGGQRTGAEAMSNDTKPVSFSPDDIKGLIKNLRDIYDSEVGCLVHLHAAYALQFQSEMIANARAAGREEGQGKCPTCGEWWKQSGPHSERHGG